MRLVIKGDPMWCRVYARRTPSIPVHNGTAKCIGCGADVLDRARAQRALTEREQSESDMHQMPGLSA
jgi:hypothetical protein